MAMSSPISLSVSSPRMLKAVIFLAALSSNAVVLAALRRQLRRKPSSRMYHLMFHLSLADLLVAVLNILPQLIWDITYRCNKQCHRSRI